MTHDNNENTNLNNDNNNINEETKTIDNEEELTETVMQEILSILEKDTIVDDNKIKELLTKTYNCIVELKNKENDTIDQHSRLLADFINYKNRVSREIQFAVTLSEKKILLDFLPVLDNFERCLSSNYTNIADIHSGISLIHKQWTEVIHKIGVEEIKINIGDQFDAQYAEALTTAHDNKLADNAITNIFEKGYTLNKNLLRPAKVIVNNNDNS